VFFEGGKPCHTAEALAAGPGVGRQLLAHAGSEGGDSVPHVPHSVDRRPCSPPGGVLGYDSLKGNWLGVVARVHYYLRLLSQAIVSERLSCEVRRQARAEAGSTRTKAVVDCRQKVQLNIPLDYGRPVALDERAPFVLRHDVSPVHQLEEVHVLHMGDIHQRVQCTLIADDEAARLKNKSGEELLAATERERSRL
jgi:hypothetical protein